MIDSLYKQIENMKTTISHIKFGGPNLFMLRVKILINKLYDLKKW
jgi:hypothetical protein